MGKVSIFAADVGRIAGWIELFDPGKVPADYKRRALTAVLLQDAAVASRFAAERTVARAAAEARLGELTAAPEAAPEAQTAEGGWSALGLVLWGATRSLPLDTWAGPIEDTGRFLLVRPTAAFPSELPGADEFRLEAIEFPFVPPDFDAESLQATIEAATLTIIDPKYGDLVPAIWRYWMSPND